MSTPAPTTPSHIPWLLLQIPASTHPFFDSFTDLHSSLRGANYGESVLGRGDSIYKGSEAGMKFVGWESTVAQVVAAGEQRGEG